MSIRKLIVKVNKGKQQDIKMSKEHFQEQFEDDCLQE